MDQNDKRRFIIFGEPSIEEPEIKEVASVMESGWLGTGPRVAMFESEFKRYIGANHAVALNSCTAALHLSLVAAGIGPGDEVITTPLTFCATVNAIIHSGAKPVLADINPETMNIEPEEVKKKITGKTKAILPVHFAGRPCDMDELMKLKQEHHLIMIEDCAHAIETEYKGKKVGTFGEFGCFSFYATKNVVTGEGGMVTTQKQGDYEKLKVLSLHGMSKDAWGRFSESGYKHYQVVEAGFKYNMMDIQAAIGIHQLRRVEDNWAKRKQIWNYYSCSLKDTQITLPKEIDQQTRHAYHLYTILIDEDQLGVNRDQFLEEMTKKGIGVGVHYQSITEHPYYQKTFGWNPNDYPHSTRIGRQTLSLPISVKMTGDEIEYVMKEIKEIIKKA